MTTCMQFTVNLSEEHILRRYQNTKAVKIEIFSDSAKCRWLGRVFLASLSRDGNPTPAGPSLRGWRRRQPKARPPDERKLSWKFNDFVIRTPSSSINPTLRFLKGVKNAPKRRVEEKCRPEKRVNYLVYANGCGEICAPGNRFSLSLTPLPRGRESFCLVFETGASANFVVIILTF